jgi:photosynthetic reaction center H subunit
MQTGAITQYIDVAQVALYVFWIFFVGLILYLRREDKREGYPLETELPKGIRVQGFPSIPEPKTFLLRDGKTVLAPDPARSGAVADLKARPNGPFPGAPLEPTGNPMLDGVGPGAYANRADVPEKAEDGTDKIVPLRVAPDYHLESRDPDPRGMQVLGADGVAGGVVVDAWVDRAEAILRYLELEVAGGRRVLLPINFARINGRKRCVSVKSIMGRHFAEVPGTRNPTTVTLLEEDRIMAYYGAGTLYAEASRLGPLL